MNIRPFSRFCLVTIFACVAGCAPESNPTPGDTGSTADALVPGPGEDAADVESPGDAEDADPDGTGDPTEPDVEPPACEPGCADGCTLKEDPDWTSVVVLGNWALIQGLGESTAFADALAAMDLADDVQALLDQAAAAGDLRIATWVRDDSIPGSYALDRQTLCAEPDETDAACVVTATRLRPLAPSGCPQFGAASILPGYDGPAPAALPWLLAGEVAPLEWPSLSVAFSGMPLRFTGRIDPTAWLERLAIACASAQPESLVALCAAQASIEELALGCSVEGCAVVIDAGLYAPMATLVVPPPEAE